VTAKVLSFPPRAMKAEDRMPGADKLPKPVRADGAPAAPMPPARGEQILPKGEPLIRDPRVTLPMSVFQRMGDALIFYSNQGFDHGAMAREAMIAFAPPQPTPGAAA
jgi:hypothetical protein